MGYGRRRLAISMRGLLLWGTALLAIGYVTSVLVFFQWMDGRPFNLVTFSDCVLYPVRRDVIKAKQGQAFVLEGLDDIKARRVRPGMQKLTVGIERYPQELMGRLVLANIYVLMNSNTRAVTVLRNGFPYFATDRRYMENVFQFAVAGEDDELWQEACDAALAQSAARSDLAPFRLWIIQRKIIGLTEAGHSAEAARLAEASGASADESLGELEVLALLKNGETKAALSFIETWQQRNGPSSLLRPLLIRALRETGQREDMERALADWCRRDPTNPTPYVNVVVSRAMLRDTVGAQAALESFFIRFNSRIDNLIELAKALVLTGETALSRQCLASAEDQGFPTITLQQLLMETCITKGEWDEAQTLLNRLTALQSKNDPSAPYWRLMTLLVAATLDPAEGVQSNLISTLQDQRMTLVAYRRLISVLRAAGRNSTALGITQLALSRYPNSASIKQTLTTLAIEVAADKAAKPRPVIIKLQHRQDTADTIEAATRATLAGVNDETLFFEHLEVQIKSDKANEALSAIHAARDARPEWLNSRRDDLSLMEIRLYAKQKDTMTVQGLVHFYINGDLDRSKKIMGLAMELHGTGDIETAVFIAREILRKTPHFRMVERTLDEWAPPSKTIEP